MFGVVSASLAGVLTAAEYVAGIVITLVALHHVIGVIVGHIRQLGDKK